jgi:hypothetical protein
MSSLCLVGVLERVAVGAVLAIETWRRRTCLYAVHHFGLHRLFFLFYGWLSDRNKETARVHFTFMVITFLIGLYSLKYLAST